MEEQWKKEDNLKPFQPGQSGNPEGRQKGTKNMSTILKEMLELETEVEGVRMTYKDAIIKKLIKKSNAGNMKAIQEVFDRTEGKAKQEIKHDITRAFMTIDPLADDQANDGAQENSQT